LEKELGKIKKQYSSLLILVESLQNSDDDKKISLIPNGEQKKIK
jgi:hypothetical protein